MPGITAMTYTCLQNKNNALNKAELNPDIIKDHKAFHYFIVLSTILKLKCSKTIYNILNIKNTLKDREWG